ncbi:hypothetical protein [Conexibacter sp. S30A1]|uniref:hypothetical protein n=1 Tax=Conexibacter sp. S30A1 TaxID=2937800 RepID=UPI00200DF336|nr:hypothetical protein [Conexibacter sp. S30A1]
MTILLRIGLTPIAFALVTWAQASFGDRIGGRLIGLPVTTGPFLLAVCLTASRLTAAHAAIGVTTGQMSVIVFCVAYAWLARGMAPVPTALTSLALALASVLALSWLHGPWPAAAAVWTVIGVSLLLWPWPARRPPVQAPPAADARGPERPPSAQTQADMPHPRLAGSSKRSPALTRALISTCVVATMATLVPVLGARPAGVITSAPVLLSIILPSTHRLSGAAGAAELARGTIVSMAATISFSAVLASCLPHMAVASALLVAAGALVTLIVVTPLIERALLQAGSALSRPEPVF